jgi:hypothetical protein
MRRMAAMVVMELAASASKGDEIARNEAAAMCQRRAPAMR